MHSVATDSEACLVVVRLYGGPLPEDYEVTIQSAAVLDAEGIKRRKRTAQVLIVEDGYPRPDATQRKALVESVKHLKITKPLFALVTPSPLIRGVLTVLNWIAPPVHEIGVFDTFAEAARWIETQRGEKLPQLQTLHATVSRPETAGRVG